MSQPGGEIRPQSDRELLESIRAELGRVGRQVDQLAAVWREYEPIAAAFRRGGWLAARTARKVSDGRP